jgi:hypothetical protein
MKFIELTTEVCINKDKIEMVASANGGATCTITFVGKEYNCSIPYRAMREMLKQGESDAAIEKLNKYLSVATVSSV